MNVLGSTIALPQSRPRVTPQASGEKQPDNLEFATNVFASFLTSMLNMADPLTQPPPSDGDAKEDLLQGSYDLLLEKSDLTGITQQLGKSQKDDKAGLFANEYPVNQFRQQLSIKTKIIPGDSGGIQTPILAAEEERWKVFSGELPGSKAIPISHKLSTEAKWSFKESIASGDQENFNFANDMVLNPAAEFKEAFEGDKEQASLTQNQLEQPDKNLCDLKLSNTFDGKIEMSPLNLLTDTVQIEDQSLPIDEAVELFRHVLQQVGRQKGSGHQKITIKLDPPELGKIQLTLFHRNGALSARFVVENDLAHGALQSNMAELEHNLSDIGIRIEDFGVFVGLGQGDTGPNESYDGQGQTMSRHKKPASPMMGSIKAQPCQIEQRVSTDGNLDLMA